MAVCRYDVNALYDIYVYATGGYQDSNRKIIERLCVGTWFRYDMNNWNIFYVHGNG